MDLFAVHQMSRNTYNASLGSFSAAHLNFPSTSIHRVPGKYKTLLQTKVTNKVNWSTLSIGQPHQLVNLQIKYVI